MASEEALRRVFRLFQAEFEKFTVGPEKADIWLQGLRNLDDEELEKAARRVMETYEYGSPGLNAVLQAHWGLQEGGMNNLNPMRPLPAIEEIEVQEGAALVRSDGRALPPWYDPKKTMAELQAACKTWRDEQNPEDWEAGEGMYASPKLPLSHRRR